VCVCVWLLWKTDFLLLLMFFLVKLSQMFCLSKYNLRSGWLLSSDVDASLVFPLRGRFAVNQLEGAVLCGSQVLAVSGSAKGNVQSRLRTIAKHHKAHLIEMRVGSRNSK